MKNKAAKLKSKRKGSENAFGCDLTEHLQNSGHDGKFLFCLFALLPAAPTVKMSRLYYKETL